MTKVLTTLIRFENYEKIKDDIDGLILGVNGLSVNYPTTYSLEEILTFLPVLQRDKKELFVAINKNFHKEDLELLEQVMMTLDSKGITGFLYYDIAVVEKKEQLHLKTPLVWAQEHLTTNYVTCNYWHQFGAIYTLLSGEITLEEIVEIKKNAKSKLIVPIFGRLPMFVSRRHLVQNYFRYFQDSYLIGSYELEKEGNSYPIIDSNFGTIVYSSYYLNGLKESLKLKKNGIDYIYCNPFDVEEDIFSKILHCYASVNEDNQDSYEQQIDEWLEGNTDKGFLYKETVYKVK